MTRLTAADLAAETADLLPDRDTLSVFNVADILAGNSSIAANVVAFGSKATSAAFQLVAVSQS